MLIKYEPQFSVFSGYVALILKLFALSLPAWTAQFNMKGFFPVVTYFLRTISTKDEISEHHMLIIGLYAVVDTGDKLAGEDGSS